MSNQTFCPQCDYPMVSFSSMDRRYCMQCKSEFDWDLKPGQASLHGDRVGGVEVGCSRLTNPQFPARIIEQWQANPPPRLMCAKAA